MGLTVKHAFTSAKAADPDPSKIDGPKWNADHTVTGAIDAALLPADLVITSSIAAGSSPASAGPMRIPFDAYVTAPNSGATANIRLIGFNGHVNLDPDGYGVSLTGRTLLQSQADGDLLLTNNAGTSFGTMRFGGIGSGNPALRKSGAELQCLLADGSDYATFRAKTFLATGGSIQATTTAGFIAVGSPAATQGAIRLWKDGYIYTKNQAENADVLLLGAFPPGVFLGSSGAPVIYPGSGDGSGSLGDATHRWANGYFTTVLVVGTNPAGAGALRLANLGAVVGRNFNNDGDLNLVKSDASNGVIVGGGSTNAYAQFDVGASHISLGCINSTTPAFTWTVINTGALLPGGTFDLGAAASRIRTAYAGSLDLTDGIAAPAAVSGSAKLYVDTADGDLKVIFGDGTIKTIVLDT